VNGTHGSSRAPRLALLALGLLLLAGAGGCAGARASKAAEAQLQQALAGARCEKTLDEAWDEARRLLAERGYPLAGPDARLVGQETGILEKAGDKGGALGLMLTRARQTRDEGGERVLETAWFQHRRYKLVGAAGAPGCHVTFLAIREDPYEPNRDLWEAPRRDLQAELELLRRLAPDEAARVAPSSGGTP
jgi:hypothetical protein